MKKKIINAAICLALVVCLIAWNTKPGFYRAEFAGLFDTYSVIVGYSKNQKQFSKYAQIIRDKMAELDGLFTIYDDVEAGNNLKAVNDNAGIAPVAVADEVIELLKYCKELHAETNGAVNIAMGAVLSIWHDYRTAGTAGTIGAATTRNAVAAQLPPMEILLEASKHIDINDIFINEENKTVFLADPLMSIDVGAIAKGYSAGIAVELAKEAGMTSVLANFGGNTVGVGKPQDGTRARWGVGIQEPDLDADGTKNILDTVFINDSAVVSSGSYQRFYIVDGKKYGHIIDPATLMPANRYKAVTVIHEQSGLADALSTALYILPIEEGRVLLKKYNAHGLWVKQDGTLEATDGYIAVSKKLGGYGAAD